MAVEEGRRDFLRFVLTASALSRSYADLVKQAGQCEYGLLPGTRRCSSEYRFW